MSVSVPSSIKTGENFNTEISFKPADTDTNVDIDIEITANGILVHKATKSGVSLTDGQLYNLTINSNNFDVEDEGKIWNENLMNYACANNMVIEVTISGDVDTTSDSDKIDLDGDDGDLSLTLNPSSPSLDSNLIVNVTDEDDKKVNSASVKVTWVDDPDGNDDGVWDIEDKYKTSTTSSSGKAEYKLSSQFSKTAKGKYQVDAYKNGYCKATTTFTLANTIIISTPDPENPKVGDAFRVMVTAPGGRLATGMIVQITPGGYRSQVMSDGYAKFTVSAPGTYSIIAGGGSTGYDEAISTLKISTKAQMSVDASPDPQATNKPVIITVEADGNPIDGATVKVKAPGQSEQTLPGTTSNAGTISYTPTAAGDYTLSAAKTGYDQVTGTFSVKNNFVIDVPAASQLKKGAQVTISVKDQSGAAVGEASVTLPGTAMSCNTDSSGRCSFTLSEVGQYTVIVKKTGFVDGTASMSSSGQLSLKLDKKELTIGESVKITVVSTDGAPTEADLKISSAGVSDNYKAAEYTYTPKKSGDFTVEASKQSYSSATDTFKVKPRQITLSYMFNADKLVINATYQGAAAAGVNLRIRTSNATLTAVTDSSGIAQVDAQAAGDYIIETTSADNSASSVTAAKSASSAISDMWFPILLVLVVLVLLGIMAIVIISLMYRRGGSKPAFRRTDGTRLGR